MELIKKIYLEASNGLENSQITIGKYFDFKCDIGFKCKQFLALLSMLVLIVFSFAR